MRKDLATTITSLGLMFLLIYALPLQAAYEQKIYYAGMSCSKVQKDSIVAPANEIFIHTHVRQLRDNKSRAHKHPAKGYYTKVTRGFGTNDNRLLWQGRQQAVELRVSMWEYDDGDEAAHVFSNYLTAAIARKTVKQTGGSRATYGSKSSSEFRSAGSSAGPSGPSNDPVTSLFKSAADNVFGTANDFMGYQRVYLGKGDWSGEPLKKRGKIRYHFVTKHRRGGANCLAYFRFARGNKYSPPLAVKKPKHHIEQTQTNTYTASAQGAQVPAHSQPGGPSPEQCRQEYEACHHQAVQCQTDFDRQYQRCIKGLEAKKHDCNEWHRNKHGRWKVDPAPTVETRPKPRNKKLINYPQCERYSNTTKHCGHAKSKCNTPGLCLNSYHRCDSNAKLSQPLPVPSHAQQAQQAPKEIDKGDIYQLTIKNSCKQDVSVAYRYKSLDDKKWVTRGWLNIKPGKSERADVRTYTTLVYIHSTRGWIKNRNVTREYPVINSKFKYRDKAKLKGKGLRTMPFHGHRWRASVFNSTATIVECNTHTDKQVVYERGRDAMVAKLFELALPKKGPPEYIKIDKLLSKARLVNARNAQGDTLLHQAQKYSKAYKQMMKEWGYKDDGGTRLQDSTARVLIKHGADVNARDKTGRTPLHVAAASPGRYGILNLLLEHGADIKAKTSNGKTAFDIAQQHANMVAVAPILKAGGTGDVNKKDSKGNTLLHLAAYNRYIDRTATCKLLLKQGANPNAKNVKGQTPLDLAKRKGDKELVQLLLEASKK